MRNLNKELFATLVDYQPSKSDLKRIQLVQFAIDCIASEGVDSLTFDWVGKRAKMSRSHVIYYFADREALVEAAIRFICRSAESYVVAALATTEKPKERLLACVKANFTWLKEHPKHLSVLLLLLSRAAGQQKYAELAAEIRAIGHARLAELYRQACGKKTGTSMSPSDVASSLQALILGYLMRFVEAPSRNQVDRIMEECANRALDLVGRQSMRSRSSR